MVSKNHDEKTNGFATDLSKIWKLPNELVDFYRSLGINYLFPWQIDCLITTDILNEACNLIISAPTSAGKTIVAEILMWKRLTETRQKALYVIPFVSLGREKAIYLQSLFKSIGLKVETYISNQNAAGGIYSWDVAVCTIEKANNLINRCIEENTLDLIGMVVIDEFHTIGDPQRGYIIELIVTKILQSNSKRPSTSAAIQIVGMSATISNLTNLATWLTAKTYVTDYRPVILLETYFSGGHFYDSNQSKLRSLAKDFHMAGDQDNIVGLCAETVAEGHGVLVFCATKSWCEKLSVTVASFFDKLCDGNAKSHLSYQLRSVRQNTRSNFISEYKKAIGFIDSVLLQTLPAGVAFHHAGLTMEEREQLELAFRKGFIRVLVATSTLSSGVNLPAKRVIIRSPWGRIGSPGPCLTTSVYKQMIGRAGRQGMDTSGESIIVCKPMEIRRAVELMTGNIEAIGSALLTGAESASSVSFRLARAILEAIVGGMASTLMDTETYAMRTLLASEVSGGKSNVDVQSLASQSIDYLLKGQFIVKDGRNIGATQLGRAALASAVGPDEALFMLEDLKAAQRSLALDNELHMVYLVTPMSTIDQWGSNFDWLRYHDIWCRLSDDFRRVGELVGVSEAFMMMASRRGTASKAHDLRRYRIHMRFYVALALAELIDERPIAGIADRFGCNRGFLQSLQQQASTYAGMATTFCDRLGWNYMKSLLMGFGERIAFGVRRELTELVQIDGIDGYRARCFHQFGLTSLASIVFANTSEVAAALRSAVPFKCNEDDPLLKRSWLAGFPDVTESDAVAIIHTKAKALLTENLSKCGLSLEKCLPVASTTVKELHQYKNGQSPIVNPEPLRRSEPVVNLLQVSNSKSPLEQSITIADKLDEVVANIGRFSITPRSCNGSTNTSSCKPIKRKSSLGELCDMTASQLDILFRQSPNVSSTSITNDKLTTVQREKLSVSMQSTDGAGPVRTNSAQANEISSPVLFDSSSEQSPSLFIEGDDVDSENCSDTENGCDFPGSVERSSRLRVRKRPLGNSSGGQMTPLKRGKSVAETPVQSPEPDLSTEEILMKRNEENRWNLHGWNQSNITVVDVCSDQETFKLFASLWQKQKLFGFSPITIDGSEFDDSLRTICTSMLEQPKTRRSRNLIGLAVCWSENIVYYISFDSDSMKGDDRKNISETDYRMKTIRDRLCDLHSEKFVFDLKSTVGAIIDLANISPPCYCLRTAYWMINCRSDCDTLVTIDQFISGCLNIDNNNDSGSVVDYRRRSVDPQERICIDLATMFSFWPQIRNQLADFKLWKAFTELEMPAMIVVSAMEQNGIGFDRGQCQMLRDRLTSLSERLETESRKAAGRPLMLSSTFDLSKALFVELGLPADLNGVQRRRSSFSSPRRHYSTSKQSLEKLKCLHPLPDLILRWRKIQNALTTAVDPMLRYSQNCVNSRYLSRVTSFCRIFGVYDWWTATGRVIMQEPSLQNMPREFDIGDDQEPVIVRNMFVAEEDYILISADYSQLELRILAHLSDDVRLLEILNKNDGDVFKMIASSWLNLEPDQVDIDQRQRAKKLCYGVIYGMGAKTLATELDVTEETAMQFINSFSRQFQGVSKWMIGVIEDCRQSGYVTTICGRRRYLPAIKSVTASSRQQAERQAVNTLVQGSAADLFKTALRDVNEALERQCPVLNGERPFRFVLQLHDELILEVRQSLCYKIADIVRQRMESCFSLSARLKVRILSGKRWGQLSPLPG